MTINSNYESIKSPPIWLWFVVFVISIIAIFIVGTSSKYLEKYWHYIAIYNTFFIVIAVFYLIKIFRSLYKNKHQKIAGSGFSISLAKILPVLTLIPVISFYAFSFTSVQNNLELANKNLLSFNTKIVNETQGIYQDLQINQTQKYIDKSSNILKIISNFLDHKDLDKILNNFIVDDVCKIEVFKDKELLSSSDNPKNCQIWTDYKITDVVYSIDDNNNSSTILTQLPLKSLINTDKNITLAVFYQKDFALNNVLSRIAGFQEGIKKANIVLNANIITRQFVVDFSTTILLTLISILIIVMKMLEKIMIPLNELSIASNKISRGEYGKIINQTSDSDIKNLINEFNAMSLKIKRSKIDIENKNRDLETIITYSSGIIALDNKMQIYLHNQSALNLLKIRSISNAKNNQKFANIITHLHKFKNINENIKVDNKLLDITGVKISSPNIAYIIVIKDISDIIKTQKLQAWNEVARRMAHEIKNPLNPIMLSAQRLRNKYLQDENNNYQIIDKTTKTIIDQVESISLMVSSFAEYGRTPKLKLIKQDLNKIIKSVKNLYDEEYNITLNLSQLPEILLDKNAINRVLINLIKNSIEAKKQDLKIIINTYQQEQNLVLEVIDNGTGFDKSIIDKVFEPYATNKKSGSGLGMAIIAKIIASHQGEICVDKDYKNGAKIIITLPITNN